MQCLANLFRQLSHNNYHKDKILEGKLWQIWEIECYSPTSYPVKMFDLAVNNVYVAMYQHGTINKFFQPTYEKEARVARFSDRVAVIAVKPSKRLNDDNMTMTRCG